LDFYIFGDRNLQRNYYKVSLLTGFSILPPLFAFGYHQCRWGYNNQETIENIEKNMDLNEIPYDVIWVDIDVKYLHFNYYSINYLHPSILTIRNISFGTRKIFLKWENFSIY
jgi:alpha-glucosidase (family GH31 glycosyl hydrolase)